MRPQKFFLRRWLLALSLFVALGGTTLALWAVERAWRGAQIQSETEHAAEEAALHIREHVESRLEVVDALDGSPLRAWASSPAPAESATIRLRPVLGVFDALGMVEATGQVRWLEQSADARAWALNELPARTEWTETLHAVAATGQRRMTPPISLRDGATGYALFSPVAEPQRSGRFTVALARIERVIEAGLTDLPARQSFRFLVRDGERILTRGARFGERGPSRFRAEATIQLLNRELTLAFEPTPALLLAKRSPIPGVLSALGILGSVALAGAVWLLLERQERLNAERRKLAEREERFRLINEQVNDIIWTLDSEFHLTYVTPSIERVLGYAPDEVLGKPIPPTILSAKDWETFRESWSRADGAPQAHMRLEAEHRTKDGRSVWCEVDVVFTRDAEGRVVGAQGVTRDITERKRAQDAIEEREARLRALMGNLPGMVYRCRNDRDWTMEFLSEGCLDLTGYPPASLLGNARLSYATLIDPADRDAVWVGVQAALEQRQPFELLYRIRTAQGETKWVAEHGRGVYDKPGRLLALEGLVLDVTERVQAEDDLRRAHERLRFLVERTSLAVMQFDTDFRIVEWNPAAERTFGFARQEALGRSGLDLLVPPQARDEVEAIWRELMRGETLSHSVNQNLTKGGQVITCEWFNTSLVDEKRGVVGVASMVRDQTEQLKLEAQFRQAQKMEAVGTLAGGIAHDFNNILTGVLGSVEFALMETPPEHGLREPLEAARDAAWRAADLTKHLLALSRKYEPTFKNTDLADVVQRTARLLGRSLPKSVRIEVKADEGVPWTRADAGQIEQALLNLAINARDAMPDGGTLSFHTGVTTVDDIQAAAHPHAEPGEYVVIDVTDTGCGMSHDVVDRIFEPFFTTKQPGEGTGLGLAMVYASLRAHGGWVNVYSEPGRGATFRLYFPCVAADAREAAHHDEARLPGGSETILLVDDAEVVLFVGKALLERLGYTVRTAHDGQEALASLRNGARVDLVISDLVMPNMGGLDLLKALRDDGLTVPVLLTTGYAPATAEEALAQVDAAGVLLKPFEGHALASKVRQVLDAR